MRVNILILGWFCQFHHGLVLFDDEVCEFFVLLQDAENQLGRDLVGEVTNTMVTRCGTYLSLWLGTLLFVFPESRVVFIHLITCQTLKILGCDFFVANHGKIVNRHWQAWLRMFFGLIMFIEIKKIRRNIVTCFTSINFAIFCDFCDCQYCLKIAKTFFWDFGQKKLSSQIEKFFKNRETLIFNYRHKQRILPKISKLFIFGHFFCPIFKSQNTFPTSIFSFFDPRRITQILKKNYIYVTIYHMYF